MNQPQLNTQLHSQAFVVTLTQDVVISASSATAGQHLSLDYLPGSLFLGLAASRGYAELETADAWTLFHSGKVRFLDALPLIEGQPSLPAPLSLHTYKGECAHENASKRLIADKVFDPSLPADEPSKHDAARQPKQLRKGYITETGLWHLPTLSHRMKTAIDPTSGRAAQSQLFGYQALQAGQQFLFTLQADHSALSLFNRCVAWLNGSAQLGRSRSAQYGGVNIMPAKSIQQNMDSTSSDSTCLTLLLQSDLALLDANGQPCLTPYAKLFGLPEGSRWLIEQSFIRTRRYSQYNAKRRCFDTEREVISRGSVLRYKLAQPLSAEALASLQSVGLYQESGLGQMVVNPTLLAARHPQFSLPVSTTCTKQAKVTAPDTPLIRLLQRRIQGGENHKQASEQAADLFADLCIALKAARSWLGLRDSQPLPLAPGRSQWGQLKKYSSDHRSRPEELWRILFDAENALIRGRSGWDLSIGPETNLSTHFKSLCESKALPSNEMLGDIMGELATLGLSQRWQHEVEGTAIIADKEAVI
jgi:hypothetical protein